MMDVVLVCDQKWKTYTALDGTSVYVVSKGHFILLCKSLLFEATLTALNGASAYLRSYLVPSQERLVLIIGLLQEFWS